MPVWQDIPLLHAGSSEPSGWLHSDWIPEPMVFIGMFALTATYLLFTGSRNRTAAGEQINPISLSQRICFILGALTILIALNPPIDDWSGHFLLLAHMFQHLMLIMIAMPLLIAGTPPWLMSRVIAIGPVRPLGYLLTRPIVAFVISNLLIVIWHMPVAYDAALRNLPVHIFEHMTFLLAGFLLWWPVLGRNAEWTSLEPLPSCLYLFLQGIPGSIVGAFITFASPGLYAVYPQAPRIWGLSLSDDQQLAGLLMWVINGLIYLGWITIIFLRWASAEDHKDRGRSSGTPAPVRS
jgi:putative membrane protein